MLEKYQIIESTEHLKGSIRILTGRFRDVEFEVTDGTLDPENMFYFNHQIIGNPNRLDTDGAEFDAVIGQIVVDIVSKTVLEGDSNGLHVEAREV